MRHSVAVGVVVACSALQAHALETTYYDIKFDLTSVQRVIGIDCARPQEQGGGMYAPPHWGCLEAGASYSGRVGIDSSLVTRDGKGTTQQLYILLSFGQLTVYDYSQSGNFPVDGYHYPVGIAGFCPGRFGRGCIEFTAKDGQLVALDGEWAFSGDSGWIRFTRDRPGEFSGYSFGQSFEGTVSISPVPEPSVSLLFLLGIPAIGALVRNRRRNA